MKRTLILSAGYLCVDWPARSSHSLISPDRNQRPLRAKPFSTPASPSPRIQKRMKRACKSHRER